MKSKKRFRKLLSFFAVIAMVVTMIPTTVFAMDNTVIYDGGDNGISVSIDSGAGAVGSNTVDFTVVVDGAQVNATSIDGVPTTLSQLHISAEGYDVTFDTDGMSVTPGVNGNYNIGFDVTKDTHSCTINFATSKTRDDIVIGEYGTFSWSKQHAGTSAYARNIEIYVNEEYAYTQTVNTPETLSNAIGVNQEFWFTPAEGYNAVYDMNKTYLDTVANQTLGIYLTTKCGCGRDTCLCEGGNCGCQPGCECDACMGTNLEDNQINTGYGILEYAEPGSQGGYRLQVKINLNGTEVYSSDWLRVGMGLPGNLQFTPTEGKYFYQKPNDYNLSTLRSGSTWIEEQEN